MNGVLSALPYEHTVISTPGVRRRLSARQFQLTQCTYNLMRKITNISAVFVQGASNWRKYGGTEGGKQSSWWSIGAEHSKDN
jgi:hypothetical protein